jgi:RNA polymerase sigma-70 factor (ECF subfamily)
MLMWLCAALAGLAPDERGSGDDRVAMSQLAAGDPVAFAALYDRHVRPVYSLALRILGDEGDAEDLVQEVFAYAWRRSSSYESNRGTVMAWLLTITRSRAIDRLRARRARPDHRTAADPETLDVLPAQGAGPDDQVLADEDARKVRAALERLPLLQRLALELAYFEGLTQSEIAERLEAPLGTVKTRIRAGLLKLREALSGEALSGGGA